MEVVVRNLPVRFKISAVAFTPMLAAPVLAVGLGIHAQQRAAAATHSRARTELAVSAAELVHEVERERAYTSGFVLESIVAVDGSIAATHAAAGNLLDASADPARHSESLRSDVNQFLDDFAVLA